MKNYAIRWKADNGRVGQGSLLFSKDAANEIVREMNYDYPTIMHEAVESPSKGTVEHAQPENHEQDKEHDKAPSVDVRKRTVRHKHANGA